MTNIAGLVVSFLFVGVVLAVASFLRIRFSLPSGITRKIIHISVSNWWLILMAFFDSLAFAVIGPICFIAVNSLSVLRRIIPAMELEKTNRNYGTVYFPISLLILVILSFTGIIPIYAGAVGVLIMGYGDGMASLLGEYFGKRTFSIGTSRKSWIGTAAMAGASFIISFLIAWLFHEPDLRVFGMAGLSLAVCAAATAVELVTPKGLDNLTVPLSAAAVFTVLLKLIH